LFILRWDRGFEAFNWLGDRVAEFLLFTDAGSSFIFGAGFEEHFFAFKVSSQSHVYYLILCDLVLQILPTVIFFSCVISVLYYIGAMQLVIRNIAWVMQVVMGTTAGESLNAAANIFVGQTEAPLVIRPILADMTKSELHAVMTGGFATIAGGVLAAYIHFGVGILHLYTVLLLYNYSKFRCLPII
jgi:pyrimidine nucleoside transport protein